MIRLRFTGLAAAIACLLITPSANAETVLRFDFASTSNQRDVGFTSGEFATIGDPGALLPTGQFTGLQFDGFLAPLFTDIASGAELSLTGLQANGSALSIGTAIVQEFNGGSLSVYDDMSNLLLSGTIGASTLVGSSTSGTAQLSNSSAVTFTGGSLLSLLEPDSGAFSITMVNVRTGSLTGLRQSGGLLSDFTADASGQIEAAAVPEPGSIGLLSALVLTGFGLKRRKKKPRNATRIPGVLACSVIACAMTFAFASTASAGTIIRAHLNGTASSLGDIAFQNGELFTIDDGLQQIGDQHSNVMYDTFLADLFPSIPSGASFSMHGVMANGTLHQFGNILLQETNGGTFQLFDDADQLLLQGELGGGLISGSLTASTGGFITTSPIAFTNGSLLSSIPEPEGDFSISFTGIVSGNDDASLHQSNNLLSDFRADSQLMIDSRPVPEPVTLASFGFVGLASVCPVGRKRRRGKAHR